MLSGGMFVCLMVALSQKLYLVFLLKEGSLDHDQKEHKLWCLVVIWCQK